MPVVFLSLGSNAGDRRFYISAMIRSLKELLLPPIKTSRIMETEPLEVPGGQQDYLNCIVSGDYGDTAVSLLDACQAIERSLGRLRPYRHASRTADIDILLFGSQVVCDQRLAIPHPRLLFRRFCLQGISEIDPEYILPGEALSISSYYRKAAETIKLQKINYIGEAV
jgi:2-amino-4-hydroxy-6-hydroxymethyldihydropteridine diphosphokinase